MISLSINLHLLNILLFSSSIQNIRITIDQGELESGRDVSRNGTEYYSFYGIPFAKSPIGERRFKPPEEPDSWNGLRYAITRPPPCIQSTMNPPSKIIGQEDCLYLNIFTPKINSSLPVMVCIHGGAFQIGGADLCHPMYFMDRPIVFVAIQFRLSILGFLSMGDEILPGNIGMKDQVAALKWVQKNIAAFGGDAERVTIAGVSSGAMSAHLHLHSPLSAGLFHRAISWSGTALALGVIIPSETAKERARTLGILSGCSELETEKLVQCLRGIPAKELVLLLQKFYSLQVWNIFPLRPFAIVLEPENVNGAFLVTNPWKRDAINKVPWITGLTADEGAFFVSKYILLPDYLEEFSRNFDRLFPAIIGYADVVDPTTAQWVTARIKEFYFEDEDIDWNNLMKLVELFSDSLFAASSLEAIRRSYDCGNEMPVYFYLYDHRNVFSNVIFTGNYSEYRGVGHADDMISLFYRMWRFPPVTEGADFIVSERMVNYVINFMYYGDPNGKGSEKIWLPVRTSNLEYLHIGTDTDVMEANVFHRRHTFWKNILFSSFENRIRTEL